MFQQRFIKPDLTTAPPWSPLSVSLLALFFPAGGAILTVRNLQRLQRVEAPMARLQVYLVVGVYALGLTVLLLLAQDGTSTLRQPDPNSSVVISIGTAAASYLVQRAPFRSWRSSNSQTRTAPWLRALGTTVLYTLVIVVAAGCMFAGAYAISTTVGVGAMR